VLHIASDPSLQRPFFPDMPETATITLPTFLENALVQARRSTPIDHFAEGGWYITDVARDHSGESPTVRGAASRCIGWRNGTSLTICCSS
jgi:hypothetical protein